MLLKVDWREIQRSLGTPLTVQYPDDPISSPRFLAEDQKAQVLEPQARLTGSSVGIHGD